MDPEIESDAAVRLPDAVRFEHPVNAPPMRISAPNCAGPMQRSFLSVVLICVVFRQRHPVLSRIIFTDPLNTVLICGCPNENCCTICGVAAPANMKLCVCVEAVELDTIVIDGVVMLDGKVLPICVPVWVIELKEVGRAPLTTRDDCGF